MKRLKDEVDSEDPRLAEAAKLLGKIAPLTESHARKNRVRRALEKKTSTGVRTRTAAVVAVLLGLTGSAAAAFGIAQVLEGPPLEEPPLEEPQPKVIDGAEVTPKIDTAKPAPDQQAAITRLEEPSASPDEPLEAPQGARGEIRVQPLGRGKEAATSHSKRSPVTSPSSKQAATTKAKAAIPQLSEARLVQEAVAALRTSGDAEKASKLLAEYRKHSSSGHLDEEALALSIEVALFKKSPDAARHARTYLAKYPGGKFRPLAERALLSK